MAQVANQRGLFFEEFEIGQHLVTQARTLTEADIVHFAGISGDFTSLHTDAVHAAQTPFGQRVAHGLLVLSMASGLVIQTGALEGTVLAFREIASWKFSKPAFIGDTLHVDAEVTDKKDMPRLGGGAVTVEIKVLNQKDETVMKGIWVVLVQHKP
jgi:acyl dehydratase